MIADVLGKLYTGALHTTLLATTLICVVLTIQLFMQSTKKLMTVKKKSKDCMLNTMNSTKDRAPGPRLPPLVLTVLMTFSVNSSLTRKKRLQGKERLQTLLPG